MFYKTIEIKCRHLLAITMTCMLLAMTTSPIQANPHYSDWNGSSGFKADMQQGGWTLTTETFTGSTELNRFQMAIDGNVFIDEENRIRAQLLPNSAATISFDNEIAVFGFDYARTTNEFSIVTSNIKMTALDSNGEEISLLSGMVPPSNSPSNIMGFYGIGDKNFPLKFQTIKFTNVGSEVGTWGIDNLYYAEVIPEPSTAYMTLMGLIAVRRRIWHRQPNRVASFD